MGEAKGVFDTLFTVSVNEHTEEKNGLTYLSWAWAWAEVMKRYPDASYVIERNPDNGLPYWYDENTGYMVFTQVTIKGQTFEMWLPVMDGANKAMKAQPYTYTAMQWDNSQRKKVPVEKQVAGATMFDVNKAIMRCLVKNLAMFGLGLYIYAGEDLPEVPKIYCESCGAEMLGTKTMSPAQLAEYSKEHTGKVLCMNCMKKAAAQVKAKEEKKSE